MSPLSFLKEHLMVIMSHGVHFGKHWKNTVLYAKNFLAYHIRIMKQPYEGGDIITNQLY
jgi:hypothetical protein